MSGVAAFVRLLTTTISHHVSDSDLTFLRCVPLASPFQRLHIIHTNLVLVLLPLISAVKKHMNTAALSDHLEHGACEEFALPRNRDTAARLEIGIPCCYRPALSLLASSWLLLAVVSFVIILKSTGVQYNPLLFHLLILLTCVQASGVLAAPLLFFIQVRNGVGSGKSAPLVAVIALKPGVCGCRLVRVAVLVVLQVRLGCILRGAKAAKVVLAAGCCAALSLVPALVCIHPLVTCLAHFRPDQKVMLHFRQHWRWRRWCSLPLQLLRMLRLVVAQVRLSCILRGAECAEVVDAAGCCVAVSLYRP
jgi:hypothetical protein